MELVAKKSRNLQSEGDLIIQFYNGSGEEWDNYVRNKKEATFFHQIGFRKVVEESFGYKSYYLVALEGKDIVGILPLFLIRSRLIGSFLVSLPFCDYGGIIADSDTVQQALLEKSIEIGQRLNVDYIEFRNRYPNSLELPVSLEKFNLRLTFDSEEKLWKSFKDTVRNQIRKADREGLQFKVGGVEKITQFYKVYATNMRDLGTPVYPPCFFQNLLKNFPLSSGVSLVTYKGKPIGCGIYTCFRDEMELPFASSLRGYFKKCPNNLLYWGAIKQACNKGLSYFSFGRSSKDSGPYNFKKQWGSADEQLFYQYAFINGSKVMDSKQLSTKYKLAIMLWKRMPLSITNLIGPSLSKYYVW